MSNQSFSTEHLEYLLRSADPPALAAGAPRTSAPPAQRRSQRVLGVRRGGSARSMLAARSNANAPRPASADVMIGLSGYQLGLAFLVRGEPDGVAIHFGTWSAVERESVPSAVLDERQKALCAVLAGVYSNLDFACADPIIPLYAAGGLVLGVPEGKLSESPDPLVPLDRLIRATRGCRFSYLVIADPLAQSALRAMRNSLLNELRSVRGSKVAGMPIDPLAEHYGTLLERQFKTVAEAELTGGWRTAVYLLGDAASYPRVASVFRSVFGGSETAAEPVRVIDRSDVPALAQAFALPDVGMPIGPGHFRHAFQYQTLLTSAQLATYVHLPERETAGFAVHSSPAFDVVPREVATPQAVRIGRVIEDSATTEVWYTIDRRALNRHALIAGVTGSGKTNTVFHLLAPLCASDVPFLVLEPAKTEYRALRFHPQIGPKLRIFPLGDEGTSPLRLNPFEFEPGVSVATHIDLLKSVFNASFGLWDPLPQVLERCIHAVYRDHGFETVSGKNRRVTADSGACRGLFPTLSDLASKIREEVEHLGYDERVTGDLRAALLTRVQSLCIGGKGVLLDTQRSVPIADLLEQPTVIELEAVGDDDEKAFLMGLLLVRIYEHLRGQTVAEGSGLRYLIVIEEAHRLLANVAPRASQEQSNARGKAVETFTNLLSEIRAYGAGFVIAEQIPSKLAPDVLKSTNLKIVHRIVAGDDRDALGQSMNMTPAQRDGLTELRSGEAAVYSEGDDRPVLVAVPYAKLALPDSERSKSESDRAVARHMAGFRSAANRVQLFTPFERCKAACGEPYRYCEESRTLIADGSLEERFAALLLGMLAGRRTPQQVVDGVAELVRARSVGEAQSSGGLACMILHGVHRFCGRMGQRGDWPYEVVEQLEPQVADLVLDALGEGSRHEPSRPPLAEVRESFARAGARRTDPFFACSKACPTESCLFRITCERLGLDRRLHESFSTALARAGEESNWTDFAALDEVVARAGLEDAPAAARRSTALCFAMQQIEFAPGLLDRARRDAVAEVIRAYDARANEAEQASLETNSKEPT